MGFSTRRTGPLGWLDLAEDRLRLDRLSRNTVGVTFFPWAKAHSSRKARKSRRQRPPLRYGPYRVRRRSSSALQIAIEAAVVAGSKHDRRRDMATIGSFKKV